MSDLCLRDIPVHWSPAYFYMLRFALSAAPFQTCSWDFISENLAFSGTDPLLSRKCVHEIAEHNHYVQGVSWDPLNEYIATQSSDHSMHVYRINTSRNHFEVHAVGRNREMSLSGSRRHGRTSSVVSEDGRGRAGHSTTHSTDVKAPQVMRSPPSTKKTVPRSGRRRRLHLLYRQLPLRS